MSPKQPAPKHNNQRVRRGRKCERELWKRGLATAEVQASTVRGDWAAGGKRAVTVNGGWRHPLCCPSCSTLTCHTVVVIVGHRRCCVRLSLPISTTTLPYLPVLSNSFTLPRATVVRSPTRPLIQIHYVSVRIRHPCAPTPEPALALPSTVQYSLLRSCFSFSNGYWYICSWHRDQSLHDL